MPKVSIVPSTPHGGPASWTSSDLQPGDWYFEPTAEEWASLYEKVQRLSGSGIELLEVAEHRPAIPNWSSTIKQFAQAVNEAPGFALLPFPDSWSDREIRLGLWLVGIELGQPMAQNPNGDRIVSIRDEGSAQPSELVRGYQLAVGLDFHVDYCDILAMVCLQPALEGGANRLASATRIHDLLLEQDPELLEVLYQPFPIDRQDEEAEGESPFFLCPVFAQQDGQLSVRYAPRQIKNSHRLPSAPTLTAAQLGALDAVQALCQGPEFSVAVPLQRGEAVFLSNHLVLHSRDSFTSFPEPERRRHLLRLWLNSWQPRLLPPEVAAVARTGNAKWNNKEWQVEA